MRDKYGLDTKVLQFMPDMNFFPEKFNKLVCDEIYRWTLVLKKISNSHFVCRPVQIKVVQNILVFFFFNFLFYFKQK